MIKQTILAIFITASVLLFGGCIKEDTSDCSIGGVSIHFRYVLEGGADGLVSKVKDIRVYVFDHNGVLVNITDVDPTTLVNGTKEVDIAPGTYTFVAWGSSNVDLLARDYFEANMLNPADNTNWTTPAVIGRTTLEQFRMMFKTKTSSVGLVPQNDVLDDLLYAGAENVAIINTSQVQTVELDFINNCKIIEVEIDGLEYLATLRAPGADQPLTVYVLAANDRYNYKNLIDANAPTIRYEPPYSTLTTHAMGVDIKTLKLDIEYSQTNPVLLYIQKTDGTNLIPPTNVIEAIMKIKDISGNFVYQTQQDIDREDQFEFKYGINLDLSVSISINGFVIENISTELG